MSMARSAFLMGLFVGAAANVATAGSHLWRFNEAFSNADGTIQFVELKESMGADTEIYLSGKYVESDATGKQYFFPENLIPPTGNKYLLLATAGFAALPGAPTPDYIVPDGFFSVGADTLRYWIYSGATMTWANGELPTDGVLSLAIDGTTGTNSPTNYAGVTGSVAVAAPIPATSTWGIIAMALVVLAAATVLLNRRSAQSLSAD